MPLPQPTNPQWSQSALPRVLFPLAHLITPVVQMIDILPTLSLLEVLARAGNTAEKWVLDKQAVTVPGANPALAAASA